MIDASQPWLALDRAWSSGQWSERASVDGHQPRSGLNAPDPQPGNAIVIKPSCLEVLRTARCPVRCAAPERWHDAHRLAAAPDRAGTCCATENQDPSRTRRAAEQCAGRNRLIGDHRSKGFERLPGYVKPTVVDSSPPRPSRAVAGRAAALPLASRLRFRRPPSRRPAQRNRN